MSTPGLVPQPAMVACDFAALGPQLHMLASGVDEQAAVLQSSQVLTGMNPQSAVMIATTTDTTVGPSNSLAYKLTWNVEEYRIGTDIEALPVNLAYPGSPVRIVNTSDPTRRHWFYLGWFIRTGGSPANTSWCISTVISDTDPITGLTTQLQFEKTFVNTHVSTGEELLNMDMFVRLGASDIVTFAIQSSGTSILVGNGRFWIVQLSTQR